MHNEVISTPVDELVKIVKEQEKCSIKFLKEKLNIPISLIEKWIAILEEYKILKVEYKGFEENIVYIEGKDKNDKIDTLDIIKLKDEFLEKCKDKGLTMDKIRKIWPIFVSKFEDEIKKMFFEKGHKQRYDETRIQKAWLKFKKDLEVL